MNLEPPLNQWVVMFVAYLFFSFLSFGFARLINTARGGIVVAIQDELGIPVKLVGLGEKAEDLIEFDPHDFVEALFDGADA